MRTTAILSLLAATLLAPAGARAFHHHGQFQAFADGREEVPGSGQLYYTGSRRDLGLRCSSCHVEAPGRIRATVDFAPSLAGGRWSPDASYTVTVTMTGENRGTTGCGTTPNRNGITAMVTDRSGFPVGQHAPDAGGRRCGSRFVSPSAGQTTAVFGDCDGVVGVQGNGTLTRWQFTWRAPSAGAGELTLWLGVVDGDCAFDSYRDDVYETSMSFREMASAWLVPLLRRAYPPAPDLDRRVALPRRRSVRLEPGTGTPMADRGSSVTVPPRDPRVEADGHGRSGRPVAV